jgi:hypothetical protein
MESSTKGKRDVLQITLDPYTRGQALKIAKEQGVSMAEIFRRALLMYAATKN